MSAPVIRVRDVMTADPCVIASEERLERAWAVMNEQGCRHLPVVEDGHLVGILSMTDIGRLGATIPAVMARTVAESMTRNPLTADPDESIESAAGRMGLRKVNCLPVVTGGKLVGIVTTYDLLDALARQLGPQSARSLH
jgi:acetoin utilization protein AcuB